MNIQQRLRIPYLPVSTVLLLLAVVLASAGTGAVWATVFWLCRTP